MDAISKVEAVAAEYTTFVCKAVGRGIDAARELSILLNWSEAIDAALVATRGDQFYRQRYTAMRAECRTYLELNAA